MLPAPPLFVGQSIQAATGETLRPKGNRVDADADKLGYIGFFIALGSKQGDPGAQSITLASR